MALRIAEQAGLTDKGRQREANEDTFVLDEPLFAVADGMGGAQAGEIASKMAKEVLEAGDDDAGTPEERLIRMIRLANRRIYEKARDDEGRQGMGTTATAAILEGGTVTVGHVGDSRAYRLRDGSLDQLTNDHSLVSELVRSGQLSPEAAENHPQRSIITRALGPEADVEVDAHSHAARDGDVYLLCSDGLTGMVADSEIGLIMRKATTLKEAAETLVRAANQSGGKDNITVVLFRVEEDPDAPDEPSREEGETIHQGLTAEDVQAAANQERTAVAAPPTQAARAAQRPASSQPRPAAPPPRASAASRPAPARGGAGRMTARAARERRSWPRRALAALVTLIAACAICGAGALALRHTYFLGTDDAGLVTLYRGVPYELPFGIELYSKQYTSSVPARAVAPRRRARLLGHEWRSREDAEDLVRQVEQGTLDSGRAQR